MKVRITTHAIDRAIERFPAVSHLERPAIAGILTAIGHRGVPIRSMRFKETYRVGILDDGAAIILAMHESWDKTVRQEVQLVTTVLTDQLVVPSAILGETAKAVAIARQRWEGTRATPGQTVRIAGQ